MKKKYKERKLVAEMWYLLNDLICEDMDNTLLRKRSPEGMAQDDSQ